MSDVAVTPVNPTTPAIYKVTDDAIFISGMPSCEGHLHNTELAKVVHRVKKLYQYGDRFSKDGWRDRRKHGVAPEKLPISASFQVAYTLSRIGEDVVIRLYLNAAYEPYWVDKDRKKTHPATSEREKTYLMQNFVSTLVDDLQDYLHDARTSALPGQPADYYNHPLPPRPVFAAEATTIAESIPALI